MKKLFFIPLLYIMSFSSFLTPSLTIEMSNYEEVVFFDLVIENNSRIDEEYHEYKTIFYEKLSDNESLLLGDGYSTVSSKEKNGIMIYYFSGDLVPKQFKLILLLNDGEVVIIDKTITKAYSSKIYYDASNKELSIANIDLTISILIIFLLALNMLTFIFFAVMCGLKISQIKGLFIMDFFLRFIYSILVCNSLFIDGLRFCSFTILLVSLFISIIEILYIIISQKSFKFKPKLSFICIMNIATIIITYLFCLLCVLL